jgi:PilZ domain-containing protein
MANDFRTVPRYFVVSALPGRLGEAEVHVVDLSTKGARLQLMQPFGTGATASFAMQTSSGLVTAEATVLWCRMAALSLNDEESDRYFCGVMFDRELPAVQHVIDDLVTSEQAIRIEDARSAERYTITAQMTGSFGPHAPVRIIDLSIRGARIASDRPIVAGAAAALRFRVERKHLDLMAEMMWCRPSDRRGGFESGLKIEGEETLLRQVIAQLCTKNQARVDLHSLRRKFDPMHGETPSGLLALV